MSEICKKKVIIALGHFDSVHIGHQQVIKTAVDNAKSMGVIPAVFTFDGDLKGKLQKTNYQPVYTISERISLIRSLGVDEFFIAPANDEFLSYSRTEFLDVLNNKYDVVGYVSGTDYRFGRNAEGDTAFLIEYAKGKGQIVYTVPDQVVSSEKVSTTLIKKSLINGDIKKANLLLGRNYSVTGEVKSGRKVGRDLGFPTINLDINPEVLKLRDGVYYGEVKLLGERFKAIINYGARPTFNLGEKIIEAHILDFSGDLYGKTVCVEFLDYLRDVMTFNSKEELSKQLNLDREMVKNK